MRAFSTLRILPRSGRIAWNSRSRASPAVPPALLPSTRNSSHCAGSLFEQSLSLPGRREFSSAVLRRTRSRALRAAWRARAACERLVDDRARLGRVLLEPLGERGVRGRLDEAAHRRVAELRLRLALELRVLELDRDDRDEALVRVVLPERLVLLLDQPRRARVGVDRARERGAEAREVRAALVRVDVVRERVDGRLVAVVPLHRDLDRAVLGLALEGDLRLVRGRAVLVDVAHVVGEAVLGVELGDAVLGALVDQRQPQAAREEGHLALARLDAPRSRPRSSRRCRRRA